MVIQVTPLSLFIGMHGWIDIGKRAGWAALHGWMGWDVKKNCMRRSLSVLLSVGEVICIVLYQVGMLCDALNRPQSQCPRRENPDWTGQ